MAGRIKHAFTILLLVVVLLSVATTINIPRVVASTFGLTSTGGTSYPTTKAVTANGNAQVDTAQSKFGGASGLFNGGDGLDIADSADWYFSTSAFTIDLDARFNTLPAVNSWATVTLAAQEDDASNRWFFCFWENGGDGFYLSFTVKSGGSTIVSVEQKTAFSNNTWYHLAIVRSGDSWMLFKDGSQVGTTVTDTDAVPDLTSYLNIGRRGSYDYLDGWLDEFRISNVARWTSDFSASLPTARYDRDSYTVLLLHNDLATGEVDGSQVFLDDVTTGLAKATKFTLTETGTPSSMSFYSHAVGNVRLAMFSDSSGPSSRLCETADTAVTATAWTSPSISCGSLSAADYWLVWQWNPGTAYAAGPSYNSTAGSGNYLYQSYAAFPATWTGGTPSTEQWSIYVTYSTTVTTTTTGTVTVYTTVYGSTTDSVSTTLLDSTTVTQPTTTTSTGAPASTTTTTTIVGTTTAFTTVTSTIATLLTTFTGGTSTIGTATTTTTSDGTAIVQITYTQQQTTLITSYYTAQQRVTQNITYTQNEIVIIIIKAIGKIMNVSYTGISKVLGVDKASIFAVLGVDPPVERTKQVHSWMLLLPWIFCMVIVLVIGAVVLSRRRKPRCLNPVSGLKNILPKSVYIPST